MSGGSAGVLGDGRSLDGRDDPIHGVVDVSVQVPKVELLARPPGIKLNRVSHKGVEKLVKNQASLLETTLDDGAARLKLAARADSFRALVGDQIASLPASRDRAVGTARKSIDIVVDTGNEIGGIVRGAIVDLRPTQPTAKRVTRKATATRKKVAKKATATRKRVAKKASAATKPAAKKAKAVKARATTARKKAANKATDIKMAAKKAA